MSAAASATTARSSFSTSSLYYYSKCRLSSDLLGSISFPDTRFPSCNNVRRCRNCWGRKSRLLLVPKAAASDTSKDSKSKNAQNGDDGNDENQQVQQKQQPPQPSVSLSLDDVNPVGLGRRSRQLFDEVWRKFSGLGQISRTIRTDDRDALDALLIREGPMCEFAIPGAQSTVVLVVGATSRIGRIVVRKLMLRGYVVKVPCLRARLHALTSTICRSSPLLTRNCV